VEIRADDQLRNNLRHSVQTRLENWLTAHIETQLEPLVALRRAAAARTSSWEEGGLPGPARGLAFRLAENLGHLSFEQMPLTHTTLNAAKPLKRFGVKIGRHSFYLPRLIKPASSGLTAMLWAIVNKLPQVPPPPSPGLTSFLPVTGDGPPGFLEAACFRVVAGRAIRFDILDRISELLAQAAQDQSETDTTLNTMVSLLGSNVDTALTVAVGLGWKRVSLCADPAKSKWQQARIRKREQRKRARQDSPFAGLSALSSD
jgi:ATP-dependent RNA helicase SUPV3L1/SUV3